MTLQAIGLLSPGDMGHIVGQLLLGHGLPVYTCLKNRSERTRGLAKKAGIKDLPTYEELVRETDMILSILVPSEAENAARSVSEALGKVGKTMVYVDCNAISPATSQKINTIIKNAGSKYVDASIIGPPPKKMGTTRFYASGPDVKPFEALTNYGLDVHPIGAKIGQAKGIKMVYGALTKGLAAISTQLLIAAWKMGLYNDLIEDFMKSQIELYKWMERSVPRMPNRSRRWIGEMEEISKTFNALGLTPKIYEGAADTYRFVGRTKLADETAETVDLDRTLEQVIETLANEM